MFPDGWPGRGLLLLRLAVVLILIHDGIGALMGGPQRESIPLQVIAAIAAVFLLAGLWTPIAGGIVALSELWIVLTGADDPRSTILLATLGTALAFLGPGALSVDARLFGRKRLDI
jgi:putative oxidoreductase